MTSVPSSGESSVPFTVDWDAAYRRYFRFWLSLAKGRGLSDAEGRDAVHAVISILVADQNKRFESLEHVRNYVARAIMNRAIGERQRPDRATAATVLDEIVLCKLAEHESATEKTLLDAENKAALRESLLGLPKRSFEIVKLRFFCGFSFIQISQLLCIPISTLKSREDAALARIKRSLRKKGHFPDSN